MKRIVFVGAGNISQAVIEGLIEGGHSRKNLLYIDRNKSNSARLDKLKIKKYSINNVRSSDIFILAVKPKDALSAYAEICSLLKKPKIITLVAGIKSKKYLSDLVIKKKYSCFLKNLSVQDSGMAFLFAQTMSFRTIQPLSIQPIAKRCGISSKHLFGTSVDFCC